jgi:hypothetical protein
MSDDVILRPGEIVHDSGQYIEINKYDQPTRESETTMVAGEPAPPTSKRGRKWLLVDASVRAGDGDGASPPCPPLPASAADGAAAGEGGTATANDAVRGNTRRASVRTGQRPADGG